MFDNLNFRKRYSLLKNNTFAANKIHHKWQERIKL